MYRSSREVGGEVGAMWQRLHIPEVWMWLAAGWSVKLAGEEGDKMTNRYCIWKTINHCCREPIETWNGDKGEATNWQLCVWTNHHLKFCNSFIYLIKQSYGEDFGRRNRKRLAHETSNKGACYYLHHIWYKKRPPEGEDIWSRLW